MPIAGRQPSRRKASIRIQLVVTEEGHEAWVSVKGNGWLEELMRETLHKAVGA